MGGTTFHVMAQAYADADASDMSTAHDPAGTQTGRQPRAAIDTPPLRPDGVLVLADQQLT